MHTSATFFCYYPLLVVCLLIGNMPCLSAQITDTVAYDCQQKGETFNKQHLWDSALVYLQCSEDIFRRNGEWGLLLTNLNHQSRSYLNSHRYEEAATVLREAIAIGDQHLPAYYYEKAMSHTNLGTYYLIMRDTLAGRHLNKAIEIYEQQEGEEDNWEDLIMSAKKNLVNYYLNILAYDKAEAYLLEALAYDTKQWGPNHLKLARTLGNMALLYRIKGNGYQSIEYYERGLAIALDSLGPDHPLTSRFYLYMASTYREIGEWNFARQMFQHAIDIRTRVYGEQDPAVAEALRFKASAYVHEWRFDEGISLLEEALNIVRQNGSKLDQVLCLYDLGEAYAYHHRTESAIRHLREALDLGAEELLLERSGGIYNALGVAQLKAENCQAAMVEFERAKDIYTKGHGRKSSQVATVLQNMANCQKKLGNQHEARLMYEEAIGAYLIGDHPFSLTELPEAKDFLLSNDLIQIMNDYAMHILDNEGMQEQDPSVLMGVLQTSQLATNLIDSLRIRMNQSSTHSYYLQEAKSLYAKIIESAWRLYQQNEEEQYLSIAFEAAEKNKSRLLQEELSSPQISAFSGVPDSLVERESFLREEIAMWEKNQLQEWRKGEQADASLLETYRKKIFQKNHQRGGIIRQIAEEYPRYFSLKYANDPPTIADIQEILQEHEQTLIEYFRQDSSLFVFRISGQDLQWTKIAFTDKFEVDLRQFLDNISAGMQVAEQGQSVDFASQFATDSYQWFQTLLLPVVSDIPEKLVIIPDGRLSYLPFDLLLTEAPHPGSAYTQLPFLLQKTTISYAYSAGLLLNQKNQQARQLLGGFAPSYPSTFTLASRDLQEAYGKGPESWGNLSYNGPEVSAIATLMDGKAYVGPQASEEQFKQSGHQFQILHLAMHAFVQEENPLLSGLVFAPDSSEEDGFLHAYEIVEQSIQAELAVLSACHTGAGELVEGEGVMSLARAFRYAGCPNTVMSLWQADDRATADLMKRFYHYLKTGEGKSTALTLAKREYLQQMPATHPYFWAGFVLIGDDEPIQSGHLPGFWLIIGGLLLLAGVYWIWRMRRPS
ncbi:MAG: CHAT domain-containing tetratricopeptide repeat protein [Bacteroidota bacterium]